jgi:CCAAT/enhancer binding protein (C/EBP) gamma
VQENEQLEERIKLLSKELMFLKDIFLAHAGTNHGMEAHHLGIRELFDDEVRFVA